MTSLTDREALPGIQIDLIAIKELKMCHAIKSLF